jgi:hypothetical protein
MHMHMHMHMHMCDFHSDREYFRALQRTMQSMVILEAMASLLAKANGESAEWMMRATMRTTR